MTWLVSWTYFSAGFCSNRSFLDRTYWSRWLGTEGRNFVSRNFLVIRRTTLQCAEYEVFTVWELVTRYFKGASFWIILHGLPRNNLMKVILHTDIKSVVCMVPSLRTGWTRFRIQAREKYFSLFSETSRLSLRPNQPPINGHRGSFQVVQRPGRNVYRWPPSSAEVKKTWSYASTPTPSWRGQGQLYLFNFF